MGEYREGGWDEEWGGGGERGKRSRREVVKVEKERGGGVGVGRREGRGMGRRREVGVWGRE